MSIVGLAISIIAGIGSLVCFILVLIQMFQRGQSTLGIVCIVLLFCFGIGALIVFVYGWMKHREWGITNVMFAWTGCIVASVIGNAIYFSTVTFPQPVLPR